MLCPLGSIVVQGSGGGGVGLGIEVDVGGRSVGLEVAEGVADLELACVGFNSGVKPGGGVGKAGLQELKHKLPKTAGVRIIRRVRMGAVASWYSRLKICPSGKPLGQMSSVFVEITDRGLRGSGQPAQSSGGQHHTPRLRMARCRSSRRNPGCRSRFPRLRFRRRRSVRQ